MPISVVLCSFHVRVVVEEYVDSLSFFLMMTRQTSFLSFPIYFSLFFGCPNQSNHFPTNQNNQPNSLISFHPLLLLYYLLRFFFPSHGVTPFAFPFSSSSSSPYQTEREMVSPDNNPNWVFDYGLIEDIPVPGGHLPSLDPPGALWSSPSLSCQTPLSVEFDDPFGNSDGFKEVGSRKRMRTGSCSASGSKACREKMRRDRLNDRFLELGCILDPGRPPKVDKGVILLDAVRMVTQLRDEAQKLKESNESLQEKINELKVEKNELRDEKQRLKSEKENLERQVKALSSQPGFLPHPPAIPAPFSARGQVVGGKLVPFVGYPGVSMWQFMPPAAVDTSQDHVLRPPVA